MDQQQKRVAKLAAHLAAGGAEVAVGVAASETGNQSAVYGAVGSQNDDDVVIVSALRTAIAKARKGAFKDTSPDDLLVSVFQGVLQETKIDPAEIGDVVVGNVQLSGSYSMPARTAMFRAGIPESASVRSINRQCSSGIQAVADIAMEIKTGQIDCGIGAGVESMTNGGSPGDMSALPPMNLNEIFQNPGASASLTAMGMTSENVAEEFKITREEQDALAVDSHKKSLAAQAAGKFQKEIVPVTVTVEDAEGNEKEVVVDKDEGPRAGTTLEGLAKLKPAFKKGGSTTAGNSSQVSDGAAAVLLMTRAKAKQLGLPIKAVFRGFKVVGVPPNVMGIGPAAAIPALMEDTKVPLEKVDVVELNEAFASQATYCVKKLGIPMEKVNPNGGAISLGHPLGCTGSRMVATLVSELEREKKNLGIVSMCIGTGMGAAALIERQS
ncbi:3-ketoacyl-CoA thiolase B [Durusdinium trenchii]|uniref:acetyl-CoA C-acyltransferase n=1 Tax=Durusdinium trenchii TaxID=1381693 RepID=A0ABP0PTL5_9DINO